MHGTACAMCEEPFAVVAPTGTTRIEGRLALVIKSFVDHFVVKYQLTARKG